MADRGTHPVYLRLMRRITLFAGVIVVLLTGCSEELEPEITALELREHVEYLASDDLGGRYFESPGNAAAEEYIAEEFSRIGLEPLPGEEDYLLEFPMVAWSFDPERTYLSVGNKDFEVGADFRPFNFSSQGQIEAEVVFAGYGITAPEYEYDDYAGLDVKGKIVVVMRHEPYEDSPSAKFEGRTHSSHAFFKTKAEKARSRGAAGLIVFTDVLHHSETEDLRSRPEYKFDAGNHRPPKPEEVYSQGFIAFHVTREVALLLLPGQDLGELQKSVDSGEIPANLTIATDQVVRMGQRFDQRPRKITARNVAGIVRGTDASDASDVSEASGNPGRDWIVVGAHHDHIGSFNGPDGGDTIFNGADDNASGVSGVLELAERYAAAPGKRSVVFMTFGAEEVGLFGSRALDVFDLLDFDRVFFMLNLDMIGRNPNKEVRMYGDGYTEGLAEIVESANENHGVKLTLMGEDYEGNSDMAIFHQKGIPFLFPFTGEHEDYHGTGDHADKLDYDRMEKLLNLSYDIIDRIAGIETFSGPQL